MEEPAKLEEERGIQRMLHRSAGKEECGIVLPGKRAV